MSPIAAGTKTTLPWFSGFDPSLVLAAEEDDFDQFLGQANAHAAHNAATTGLGQPLRFVAQHAALSAVDYEAHIAQTGEVPTRNNRHDRLNALVWLNFPKTKAALNRLQVDSASQQNGSTERGRIRDALTLWDENLAVLAVPASERMAIHRLLADHDWAQVFGQYRGRWHADWHLRIFGHALLEKLDAPYKSLTAHLLVVGLDAPSPVGLDLALVARAGTALDPQDFLHLPLMGIPNWNPANEAPDFYSDRDVFRPARTRATKAVETTPEA